MKKQGSYEAAVESGAKNQAAMRRTKQIMQIRKQDSYTKAIGGSFEDDYSHEENKEPVTKIRKQVKTLHSGQNDHLLTHQKSTKFLAQK